MLWNSNFHYDNDGNLIGVNGIARDITERKRAEEEKSSLEKRLMQSQKMEAIGTLAGGIAHDFNNILSPILIHSEMAMMDLPQDSPLQFKLKEIYKSGNRAKDLVRQILTFSRKEEPALSNLKISSILKETLKMLRSTIPATIDTIQNIETDHDIILADPSKIYQIIMNLCTNATHSMREKGGTLEVILTEEKIDSTTATQYSELKPGPYIKLTVKDTGHGMDKETMNNIFEPYFTTKMTGEGTGLGLSVVHGIVRCHGGDIKVESEKGKGSTFHVLFPKSEVELPPIIESKAELPMGTERILFVDDEKAAVDAIRPMLENLGYKVTTRTDSIEALGAFRSKPYAFDVIITDQTMPTMTGKDLTKELMAIRPDIPVILCTGFSEQIDEKKAMLMGIRSFVMKPIMIREIANTIREVLDKK